MSEPRTLAIRVLPQPGESLDSWLEALARRSWTSLSALLDALGLPTQERTHHLLTGLPPEMSQRLKKQLNLRAGVFEQSVVPTALFGRRAPHWRFCPQCLSEGQGRFPIRWWLPWTFACTKHQALLHRRCPSCHTEPRVFLPRSVHLHPPGHCMRRTGRRTVCGADLGELPALALPHGHPLLQAQELLSALPVHQRMAADRTFTKVDKCLSPLMESMSASDLLPLNEAARDAWQNVLADVTDLNSGIGIWRVQERRRTILTPDFFQREHTEGGTPFRVIAEIHGLPRQLVIQHAKGLGLPVHPGTRPRIIDDEKWLREQYLDRTRSIEDIAQELGTSHTVVIRHLEDLGIPRRPFGPRSMTAFITKLDESVPRDIRAAVEGTLHGWLRLRRFQISMAFPSLTAAARHLDLMPSVLASQFLQLEQDIGTRLFHRSVRHAPQRPTARGATLLHDLEDSQIQSLMQNALGSRLDPLPAADAIDFATVVVDGERAALTVLHTHAPPPQRLNIPSPLHPLLSHLLHHSDEETSVSQIHTATGMPFNTAYKQVKRLEAAGWVTSRLETHAERPAAARRRTFYSLTPAAHQAAATTTRGPAALRKTTDPPDETTGRTAELLHETPGRENY
ncbi:TniQ family protein [Streptomyces sp. AK010]|uniref:TniQ family protein n=1 Tax=Streptomyces sp. AK010 TaxID=2723074 RepID=UPI001612ACDC|nr:TniQ family protein [Streptomyces sp. AK010]MBB6416640.1 DNA-binding MarR family transcriptional regulator [Streptomyces sp. AK010]